MGKIKKIVFIFILVFTVCLGTKKVAANEFNFSVTPVIPSNQIQEGLSYFNLSLKAGQKQTLQLVVANSTNKEVTVNIGIASSTTNVNGVVEYSPNDIKADKSLKYNLSDYVKAPKKILLSPQSKQNISVEVQMPKNNFDGIMAGGLTFKEEVASPSQASKTKGVTINNQYRFVIALLMQQNTKNLAPILNMNNVTASQANSRNAVYANFENSAATFLRNMVVDAKVTKNNSSTVLYSLQKEMMSMAPNSNFSLPMSLNGKKFQAGTYHYEADVYSLKSANGDYIYGKDADGKPQHYVYKWHFDKNFIISPQSASHLNATDVSIKSEHFSFLWLIVGVIFVILALLILIFILLKRRKEKEHEKTIAMATELETVKAELEAKKAEENRKTL
ncbi:DUF916 and DUF3324 domain-containing protein [Lactococcus nasutitermitis]|uniref:DUF916 and DUF3324 domain-containing protein n=1 Tax=Lactococcus nasutitermitis TaxID=1652957 RepID=A0ABV9JC19_9LACT|nr:DUF916 and DUF3324 domain-containing protein [Lactococcus nasutitermitis]